jgi:hypothetical protein
MAQEVEASGRSVAAPFFIIGSPRSGTTLLERLLNQQSRIFIPPETEFFSALRKKSLLGTEYSAARCEDFLKFYFNTRVARLLNLQESGLNPGNLVNTSTSWGEVFVNLLEALNENPKKPRVGEKTPYHLRCATQIQDIFPEAQFIALVRDGRAVVRSRLEHPHWERNLYSASRTWIRDARLLRDFAQTSAKTHKVLVVRYESLVADTEATIRTVLNFIGESFEPGIFECSAGIPDRYHEYYSQTWMNASTAAVDPTKVDKWMIEFSDSELALMQRMMKSELEFYGYQNHPTRAAGWPLLLGKELVRHGAFKLRTAVARRVFS